MVWSRAKNRCYNKNCPKYSIYGGRGIRVCFEWRYDFYPFYQHVIRLENYGKKGYSLDRIKNNEDYKPGNVRWASRNTQGANRNKQSNNTSGYVGINLTKKGKWMSSIKVKGKLIYLGVFLYKINAINVRNKYIKENNLIGYKIQ